MPTRPDAALLAALLTAAPLAAQPPQAPETPAHFRPLEFLVGSCWTGRFPDGKQTDTHCFEWVYGRHFVRDRHVVRGGPPYEGETLYARRGDEPHVTYWYWSSRGGVSTGQAIPDGDAITFPERHVTPDGVREMRAVWRRTGPDTYRVVQEVKRGGAWSAAWTMEMARDRREGGA